MNKEYAGIHKKPYYFDKNLRVLGTKAVLGVDADKVTIVLLSLNRSEYTLLLLESLYENCPNFAGKVIIADNGSESCEIEKIKKKIKRYPFDIKLYEFGENFGVAKGRNHAFELVETEWIFSLDNDIFFVENPFPEVDKTLSETGARFCNLPLLDETGENYINNGGHLWINVKDKKKYFISGGPIFMLERNQENTKNDSVLSTFLFGGCAFYHKETFLATKGFDEKYFIGFEDIDYSLTLFRSGYKIANCCYACLVHNHPHDKELSTYDKERYRYDIINRSALYFREKNGFEVWDEVTEQFFIEQSLKTVAGGEKKNTITDIYQNAKENYHKTSLKFVDEESEETQEANQKLQSYSLALEQTVKEYKRMDEELRAYSMNQEKAINELRTMNDELRLYSQDQEKAINELRLYSQDQEKAINELRTIDDELRQYSQDQEKENAELYDQISDLKKQLDDMQNLSEKERKLIRFLRRRHK